MATNKNNLFGEAYSGIKDVAPDLSGWFSVSGDLDDFIYYDEPALQSEK